MREFLLAFAARLPRQSGAYPMHSRQELEALDLWLPSQEEHGVKVVLMAHFGDQFMSQAPLRSCKQLEGKRRHTLLTGSRA